MIDAAPAAQRLHDTDRDPERDRSQKRGAGERERVRQAVADPRRDRLVREERGAEVSVHRAAEPIEVTLGDRLVEPHRADERFALLGGDIEAHHRGGAARREVHEEKGEGAREQHHERPQRESLQEKANYFLANHHSPMYCTASRRPSSGTPCSDELTTSTSCGYQRKRYGSVSEV